MNITKLPDGRWRCRVSVTVNGQHLRKQFTGAKKADVRNQADAWITSLRRGRTDLSVSDAVRAYIDSREHVASPATLSGYEAIYRNHLQTINTRIADFDDLAAALFVSQIAKDHSPKSVRNIWGLLSSSVRMFDRQHDFDSVQLPKMYSPEIECPDDTEMKRILAAAHGTDLELPILLASSIPARRSEICALTAADVDGCTITIRKALVETKERELVLKMPKTVTSMRTVTIPQNVARLIPKRGPVTNLKPWEISYNFSRLLEKNGLPHYTFHSLRHYGASMMLSIGIPLREVQRRGGWSSPNVLQKIYSHALKDQIPVADRMISDHFATLL